MSNGSGQRDVVGTPDVSDDWAEDNPYVQEAEAVTADWMEGFDDLQALRASLRRRHAEGGLDIDNLRDLDVLSAWSDALAGLDDEALAAFIDETFVALGLLNASEAEQLLTGLRLFRRREWQKLSPHIKAALDKRQAMNRRFIDAVEMRLKRASALMAAQEAPSLGSELMETRSERNRLIEVLGALDLAQEVAAADPLLRMQLKEMIAASIGDGEAVKDVIRERTVPVQRIATLIAQAVKGVLDTMIKLEQSDLADTKPKQYVSRRERAIDALSGHMRRARELGCAGQIRTTIIQYLRPYPAVFEAYFDARHPLG